MGSFIDNLVGKCAGRSASDRLHHRFLEQQYQKNLALASSASSPEQRPTESTLPAQPTAAAAQSTAPISLKTPEAQDKPRSTGPTLQHRSNSYIPEPARRPRFQREHRSFITMDELLPTDQYANWYPPEGPASSDKGLASGHSTQPSSLRSESVSGSSSNTMERPQLLYTVPKLPEMVGVGKFRRSKTATDDWIMQNLANEMPSMAPLVKDGYIIGCGPQYPFELRKGSDASTVSTAYGQQIRSENGSAITRGFNSTSSSFSSWSFGNAIGGCTWVHSPGARDQAVYSYSPSDSKKDNQSSFSTAVSSSETGTKAECVSGVVASQLNSTIALPVEVVAQISQQKANAELARQADHVPLSGKGSSKEALKQATVNFEQAIEEDDGDDGFEDIVDTFQGKEKRRTKSKLARVATRQQICIKGQRRFTDGRSRRAQYTQRGS